MDTLDASAMEVVSNEEESKIVNHSLHEKRVVVPLILATIVKLRSHDQLVS